MTAPRPSRTHVGNHKLHPETLMLSYGYDPALSEGAVKPPVFLTSTFVFGSAEEGRDFFDYVAGRKTPPAERGINFSRPSLTASARRKSPPRITPTIKRKLCWPG